MFLLTKAPTDRSLLFGERITFKIWSLPLTLFAGFIWCNVHQRWKHAGIYVWPLFTLHGFSESKLSIITIIMIMIIIIVIIIIIIITINSNNNNNNSNNSDNNNNTQDDNNNNKNNSNNNSKSRSKFFIITILQWVIFNTILLLPFRKCFFRRTCKLVEFENATKALEKAKPKNRDHVSKHWRFNKTHRKRSQRFLKPAAACKSWWDEWFQQGEERYSVSCGFKQRRPSGRPKSF